SHYGDTRIKPVAITEVSPPDQPDCVAFLQQRVAGGPKGAQAGPGGAGGPGGRGRARGARAGAGAARRAPRLSRPALLLQPVRRLIYGPRSARCGPATRSCTFLIPSRHENAPRLSPRPARGCRFFG